MFYGVNLLCQPRLAVSASVSVCVCLCVVCVCVFCVCMWCVCVCVLWLCGTYVFVWCICICCVVGDARDVWLCVCMFYVCVGVVYCICIVCVVCMCVCCPAPLINKLQRVISQADGLPSHPFLSLSCLCLPLFSSDHRGLPIIPVPNWLVGWAGEKVLPEAVQWLREIHPPAEVASSLWSEFWVPHCPRAISTIWEGPGSTRCLAWCFIVREAVSGVLSQVRRRDERAHKEEKDHLGFFEFTLAVF